MFCVLNDENEGTLNDTNDECNIKSRPTSRCVLKPTSSKRRHRRGRRGKTCDNGKVSVKIAFNNVNRIKSSMYEIPHFLEKQKISILGIAETFLKGDEKVNIDGFKWVGKNRTGKGGGGIGFLVSNNYDIVDDDMFHSKQDEFERLWIKVRFGRDSCINLAVAYFPVEGTDPSLTDELYNQILSEIIQIEENGDTNENILVMGDFNARIGDVIPFGDPVRNSNGIKFLEFCDDAQLSIMNCSRKCKGKITWFRNQHSSTIDYVLASDNVEKCMTDMLIDEDRKHNVCSDHNMIMLNFFFVDKCINRRDKDSKLMWNIKKNHDYTNFQNYNKYKFHNWDVNAFDNPDSLWSSWKNKLIDSAKEIIGVKSHKGKKKPWWDKSIDKAIKDRKISCQSHRRWSTSGSDNKDEGDKLWEDYIEKKVRAKRLIQERIKEKRIERCIGITKEGGPSSADFWRELRGPKHVKDRVNSLKLPHSENITTDRKVMNQTIRQYFQSLGKMNKCLHNDDSNVIDHVKNLRANDSYLANTDTDTKVITSINIEIDDVIEALRQAKVNKSPGLDNITNELIKNGGETLTKSMLALFRKLVELEGTPQEWNKGIIIPIHKAGSKNDLNNYRGITLTSCVSKVFNRIIAKYISGFVEDHKLLSEVQGGFRKDYRCEDHVFTLKSVAAARLAESKPTYLAFLDFRKAFDTVWRDGLMSLAWRLGIRGSLWNIISSMYDNVQANVTLGDIETDFFEVEEGVKQGCVLSPILFCIYINELAKLIKKEEVGVRICNVQMGPLFWADDVVLIADNSADLQRMLDIATHFSKTWKINFNFDKSKVLVVGKRVDRNKCWPLGDKLITECDSYKYLGIHISRNLSDHTHVNETIKKGNRLIAYIKSLIDRQDDFNRVYYGDILWKTLALPAINYGCSVWTCGGDSDLKRIENLQLQMARYILKAPRNTPGAALLGDLGWFPISSLQNANRIKYFGRLLNLEMHRWPKLMLNTLFSLNCNVDNIRFKWMACIKNVLTKCDMGHFFRYDAPTNSNWIKSFKNVNNLLDIEQWYNGAKDKSSLNDYTTFKYNIEQEWYLLDKCDFYASSLKFKARSNTLPLEHRGRKWSSNIEGICKLCNDNCIEDLRHFLFSCRSLNNIRSEEYSMLENTLRLNHLSDIWVNFIAGDLSTKLQIMLGDTTPFVNIGVDVEVIFDKFCKRYLKRAWAVRNHIMQTRT